MRTPCRWVAASVPAAALAGQGQIRGNGARSASIHRAGDSRDRGLDLVGGVVAAEPEADTLAAHIGDDVRTREPIVQHLHAGEFEGEEMTAPGPGRERR